MIMLKKLGYPQGSEAGGLQWFEASIKVLRWK